MNVLVFGSCNIDYVYYMDHIVLSGETETTYNCETFPGGKGLNQAIAASKAGANVFFAGCMGHESDMLKDVLTKNGVDISLSDKTCEKNGHAIIQVSRMGENSIFLYPGSNYQITDDYVDLVLKNFKSGDFILLQNEINNLDYIVKKAHQKNMQIVLNPSPFNERLSTLDFNCLTYIIINEVEASAISGCGDIEESLSFIKNKYPHLKIVLTLGDKGSIYTDSDCRLYQAAFETEVVDTTAAGDTFTGYFVAGLANLLNCSESLKTASVAAALSVSKKGAAPSIPKKHEVALSFGVLREMPANSTVKNLRKTIDDYMKQNLKTARLEKLAEILGYSAAYTGRQIKKITGKSFSEVLQNARCTAAADMLLNTDMPVCEIIDAVGYKNESFFRNKFKKMFDKNPLEYRNKEGL